MAAAVQSKPGQRPLLARIPFWLAQVLIIGGLVAGMAITAQMAAAEAAAEAAAAEEENDFELEDVYGTWAWLIIIATVAEMVYVSSLQRLSFASAVQISLIVLLTVTFALMTQRVERDIFEVGIFALIIFTLIQVVFGNISPQANFRESMVGLAIGSVIIAALVGFSIWLVPFLIQLGR